MTQLLLPIIYLAFISLGLPDSLLGSAWPTMYRAGRPLLLRGHPVHDHLAGHHRFQPEQRPAHPALGTGRVTALSVGMTAAALFGFPSPASSGCSVCGLSPTVWVRAASMPP